jgi:plasmid stabilization system protein ParE
MQKYTIYLSTEATEQLDQLLDYLESRWSAKVRDNFLVKLDRSLNTISTMPYAYPASQKIPALRKCVITPLTVAYYRIKEEQIEVEIITVIDSRKNIYFE